MIKFIDNIGDYFASNYFDEDFLRKVIEKTGYSAEDLKEFNKRISPLKDKYFRFKNELLELKRPKDRIKRTHEFHTEILNALGFNGNVNDYDSMFVLQKNEGIPVRNKLYRGSDTNKKPHLFIMEMQPVIAEGDKPVDGLFEQKYDRSQWGSVFMITDPDMSLTPSVINEAISELFLIDQAVRPVYVLMLAGSEVYLMQYEKWFRGSYLKLSLEDLFDEAAIKRDYFSLFYFLLSKETLAPDSEIILMDQLDEESHKSAYAVTKDLKEGIIQAVESLANEAVYYKESNNTLSDLGDQFANDLKEDCLTIVYRLLFLFYAESRSELDILPINDQVYEKGYSLEMLRDLEQVPLTSDSAKNGYFFNDSLSHLFALLNRGYNQNVDNTKSFKVNPLDTPLFDDNRFKILKNIKFRNYIWQEIICQLSLSQKERGKARGRISYANLGINQLGSVYEGLLSYKGFFADRDYIEVKKADDPTGKEGTYAVPRSRRADFEEAEILKDTENPERDKIIPKGSFIYRLSGRDRQKSASYYTPEVLTQTVVKYTLKPILKRLEDKEMKADELLELKILEPAMGAAAFHNEVINQVAEAYLDWKQKELKRKVPPGDYREELQKVKAYIATHNVYGVDINPTAIELGKLSLWLNVIHKDMETPFFGYRLGVGNAVVGAWRKVYHKDDFIVKPVKGSAARIEKKEWWEKAPRQIPWNGKGKRKDDEVYHFLLPDKNMVPSAGIDILKKEYEKEAKHVSEWRKEFIKPVADTEFKTLQVICNKLDALFEEHYQNQKAIIEFTKDKSVIWPGTPKQMELIGYYEKEAFARQREKDNAPYYKIKMVMDYWCSLWFWDVRKAAYLPTRQQWYDDILNILEVDITKALTEGEKEDKNVFAVKGEQITLNIVEPAQPILKGYKSDEQKEKVGEAISNYSTRTALFKEERIALVVSYAKQYRFFHYELEFVEVFKERGGFDIIVGNPPWVKITFEEGDIIAEKYPEILIKSFTAPQIRSFATVIFKDNDLVEVYKTAFIEAENQSTYSNAVQNFPLLGGQKGNLYKLVLSISFLIVSKKGFIGLLHPETVYDDPNGKILRKEIYTRLLYHFHFLNELLLFAEVGHRMLFSINVYGGNPSEINFISINNLFFTSTIDETFIHDGRGICGGFKIKEERKGEFVWNTKPHKDRIIHYTAEKLKLIAKLFEEDEEYDSVKLVNIQSEKAINALNKLSSYHNKISSTENIITDAWNETNAITNGFIHRETRYPKIEDYEMIYSGPHTHVANPLSKTPRKVCTEKGHYDIVDLTLINDSYIQRTNYIPSVDIHRYKTTIDGFIVGYDAQKRPIHDNWIDYYKLSFSKMLNTSSERTLQPAIIPPKTAHIFGIISIAFKDQKNLLEFGAISTSIVFDFLIKTIGTANLTSSRISALPIGVNTRFHNPLFVRILRLNCLNKYYQQLWYDNYNRIYNDDDWSIRDERLDRFLQLSRDWSWNTPIRNSFARRWCLIEIDILTAMSMGLTLDELVTIYNISFAMMQQYEDETFYDQKGNIVFTVNRSLTGVGLDRADWEEVKNNKKGELVKHVIDYELHRGEEIIYHPPFEKCDRVEDYKRAWAHFEKVFAEKGKK